MFADLDRIDLVYVDEQGRKVAVQTDERAEGALHGDQARTLVFAVARVLGPQRPEHGCKVVKVNFRGRPPVIVQRAVEAAGATINVLEAPLDPLESKDFELMEALAGDAVEAIGRAVLARNGLEATESGLTALEAALSDSRSRFEGGDAAARYTAVLELGAAAGVVMQEISGAEWVRDEDFGHAIPFTVESEGHRCNVFGRAERFYAESDREGPSVLLRGLSESEHDGLILPVLRPAGFGESQGLIGMPLVDLDPMPEGMPMVLLVQDRPHTVAYLSHESAKDFETLLEISVDMLAQMPAEVERVEGDLPFFVVRGSFYAASKVIDRQTIAGLAESLNTETVMVGLPSREVALVAPFVEHTDLVGAFAQMVEESYEDQSPSHRLTKLIFIASADDGMQGILRVEDEEEDEGSDSEPWKF